MPRQSQSTPRPSLPRRIGAALTALRQMFFTTYGGGQGTGAVGGWFGSLFGLDGGDSRLSYESSAGSAHRNVAVAANIRVLRGNAAEPDIRVLQKQKDGDDTPVPDAPAIELLTNPNEWYDYDTLISCMVVAAKVDGNAFVLKIRSAAGVPVELWYVPSWMMAPRWPADDPSVYIDYWEYNPGAGSIYRVDPNDVIHFKDGMPDDRYGGRLFISELKSAAARTICSLNEVDGFTANLMRHGGIPPMVIRPLKDGMPPTVEDAEALTRDYRSFLDGERRGDPLIFAGPLEAVPLGFSPEQLALDKIPARLEDQICALMGVPAMLTGLTAGGEQKTYANYEESRKSFYEDTLIPLQKKLARCLSKSLLGEPGMGDPVKQRIAFDYSKVVCLGEDQDKVAARAKDLWSAGVITRADAKRMVGMDADKDDDLYVVGRGQQFLRVGEEVPPFQAVMPTPGNPNLPPGSGGGVAPPGANGAGTGGGVAKSLEFDGDDDDDLMAGAVAALPKPPDMPPTAAFASLPAPEREDGADPFRPGAKLMESKADGPADDVSSDESASRQLLAQACAAAGPDATPRDVLKALIALAESRMRDDAEALRSALGGDGSKGLAGDAAAKVQSWKEKAGKFLRRVFLAGALALTDPMTVADHKAANDAVAAQMEYLDQFALDVVSGKQKVEGEALAARAASYAGATWITAEKVARAHASDAGATEEIRYTGGERPCGVCSDEAEKGWQPVGTLLEIGSSPCMGNCRCSMEFR